MPAPRTPKGNASDECHVRTWRRRRQLLRSQLYVVHRLGVSLTLAVSLSLPPYPPSPSRLAGWRPAMASSLISLLVLFVVLLHQTAAQNGPTLWKTSPYNPGALPLAVRSPYLNTWAAQGNNPASVNNLWPTLWNSNVSKLFTVQRAR